MVSAARTATALADADADIDATGEDEAVDGVDAGELATTDLFAEEESDQAGLDAIDPESNTEEE